MKTKIKTLKIQHNNNNKVNTQVAQPLMTRMKNQQVNFQLQLIPIMKMMNRIRSVGAQGVHSNLIAWAIKANENCLSLLMNS